jgi:hypothetical protein
MCNALPAIVPSSARTTPPGRHVVGRQHQPLAQGPIGEIDHRRRDMVAVSDELDGRARLLNERGKQRRIAMIQWRHAIERVGKRAKTKSDGEHALAIVR